MNYTEKDWTSLSDILKENLWTISVGHPKLVNVILDLLKTNVSNPQVSEALNEYFEDLDSIKINRRESTEKLNGEIRSLINNEDLSIDDRS